MILARPFHSRPYSDVELDKWFGGVMAQNKEAAPLRRVISFPFVWDAKGWDRWARFAIANGHIVPPRKP